MGLLDFLFYKKNNKTSGVAAAINESLGAEDLFTEVEVLPGVEVPKVFADYWDKIEKTKLPSISIKSTATDDLSLHQSSFGYYPCIPKGFDYPKGENGNYLYPLAQINFEEVPEIRGYPTRGYLQFYIAADDDVHGINFDNYQLQKNFRVLYFEEEEVKSYETDFSFLDEVIKSEQVPVFKPHGLNFSLKDDYLGIGDVRYEESGIFSLATITKKYPSLEDEIEEAGWENFQSNGHKIGGYAYFTQEDPRIGSGAENIKDYILLLQIDSDDEIMWGDCGVANFFIHPDDLAKKDFSKVMYNWDCS